MNSTTNSTSNSGEKSEKSRPSSSARPLSIEGPRVQTTQALQPMPEQPRHPTNLQELLRLSVEATRTEDVSQNSQFQPMDEERRKFLEEALSMAKGRVTDVLQQAMNTLSNVENLQCDQDTSEYDGALEKILEFVDDLDIANDFYKIGGFTIFGPCLVSHHNSIRWRAADIIAELAQNNPFCQQKILECDLFPKLLKMVNSDPAEATRIKALHAVSCIVRGQPMSLEYMDKNEGYTVLIKAIQSPLKRLQMKSAFLFASLCNMDNSEDLKITFLKIGLIELAVSLLISDDTYIDLKEQSLRILTGLTNNNFLPALQECRKPEFCLETKLKEFMSELTPEDKDEIDMCHLLLERISLDDDTVKET